MSSHLNEMEDKHKILLVNTTQRAAKNQAQSYLGQKERIISGPGIVTQTALKKKKRNSKNSSEGSSDSDSFATPAEAQTSNKRKRENKDVEFAKRKSRSGEKHPPYENIVQNIYVERKPKKLDYEDINVCECVAKYTVGDEPCGAQCLNRLNHEECLNGYCQWGNACKNQVFQRREYAKSHIFRTEWKGWGLVLDEDVKKGQFIIEYVGEVISTELCQKRLEKYKDEEHVYFLTLDANEVIDARHKGNKARFINHSCNPNCKTDKWYVQGELKVGLFAIKDIKAGTELTFDYQFERFGPKKQKCYCNEQNCRGFLGEKPKSISKHSKKEEEETKSNESSRPSRTTFVDQEVHFSNVFTNYERISQKARVSAGQPKYPFLCRNLRVGKARFGVWIAIFQEQLQIEYEKEMKK